MSNTIEPITGVLGARLTGLNLAAINYDEFATLKAALDEHLVLYVPDQDLDRHQLAALGLRFGPPFLHPIVNNGFDDEPAVLELLRKPDDKAMFGGESWHGDVTWMNPVGHVSILHGIEVPPVGGDTGFASTIAAFNTLSDGLKDMLRGLRAVHAYHWYERREDPAYSATHPVVRRAADGREGLYINRMFTNRFDGMTVEESQPLLTYLFDHLQRHEFTCRFRWEKGGVILWDNRFTLHYPINDFSGLRRRMIRTTSLEA
ncbi:MAG: TauD/TfdA family dioxygenase [Paracoccaceae bacterium]|nr:TauD/TfdA family dioxygenase [Paracoccaceae bacterium]MDG1370573.1 TauD/TfdA family dioxygenase [Paracoccaceae bacterium]